LTDPVPDPAASDELPPPPDAPREVTAAVRRRAWAERRVRVWWLLAIVLAVIATYYAVSRLYLWNQERRLITRGQKVQAEVLSWERGGEAPKNKVLPPDVNVYLAFTHDGQEHRVFGPLGGRREQILTRTFVPLYVDPADPTRWTGRTQPADLGREMLAALMLVPFVPVLFLVAVARRRRVLRTFRDGDAVPAEVVAVGHSAAAPGSRMVSCVAHTDQADGRVIKVLLPARTAPRKGDFLWLIMPPNRPEDAVPAALFE
jgi:hypothetical protein